MFNRLRFSWATVAIGAAFSLCALPGHALKMTDFLEFEARVSGTPAKDMLAGTPDLAAAPCGGSLPERPLVLLDIVEQALCNSPRTAEAWAGARAQAAQVGVQRSNYLPKVNVVSGLSKLRYRVRNASIPALDQDNDITGRSYSLRLSFLLADFGQRSALQDQSEALLAAANSIHDAALQEVFITSAQAYFDTITASATLTAYEESEKYAKESLAAAAAKFTAGVALLTDKLQAQTAYAQAKLDRTKAEGELKNAYGSLASSMGLMANTRFTLKSKNNKLEQTEFVSKVEEMIQQAVDAHPSIKAARSKVDAADAKIRAVRAEGLPKLSLNSELSKNDQSGYQQLAIVGPSNVLTNNFSVGVQLDIPVFEGFARGYQVQSAEAEKQVRTAELNKVTQQVTLEVWKSYNSLISERENLRATEELVRNSEEAFNMAQGRYKAGVGNIIELLNAQTAFSNARQQNIKSLTAWRTARLKLAASIGNIGLWAITDITEPWASR